MSPRRLADFGLSRLVSEHKTHVSAATMGTVSYMPPEMLSEQRLTKAVSCCKELFWSFFAPLAIAACVPCTSMDTRIIQWQSHCWSILAGQPLQPCQPF